MTKEQKPLTYAATGVDYNVLDKFKRKAQAAAVLTAAQLAQHGLREVPGCRGESAYVVEHMASGLFIAHVEEGLGTKNLVADAMIEKMSVVDAMWHLTGRSYYDKIAQDTVAMIVNDMITMGIPPVSCAQHVAVSSSEWFADERKTDDLIRGWQHACQQAGCSWGPGETPTLEGNVMPAATVLAGSAVGLGRRTDLILDQLTDNEQIVLFAGNGIHANGLTLARKIAAKLPAGYLTVQSDGRTYGDALLDPTPIYVPLMRALQKRAEEVGDFIHYAVNITGHGWRKLMRSPKCLEYVIERVPEPQPVFGFMQEHGPVTDEEAYGNLNMGAGFAIFCSDYAVPDVLAIAKEQGIKALHAGTARKAAKKRLIIKPKNLIYKGESLEVR